MSAHTVAILREESETVVYIAICIQGELIRRLKTIISVLLKHQNGFVAFLYLIITFRGANNIEVCLH